ncbi:MAG: hypothetical protein AB7Q27_08310 [Acidimicrobiia bacterium]
MNKAIKAVAIGLLLSGATAAQAGAVKPATDMVEKAGCFVGSTRVSHGDNKTTVTYLGKGKYLRTVWSCNNGTWEKVAESRDV